MRAAHARLYVHLVWSTWDRLPLITAELEPLVYRAVIDAAERAGAEVRAIGGMEDHVHVLVRIPTSLAIGTLVHRIKGASARLAAGRSEAFFKWQGAYGAFSVSRWDIARIERYVRSQKEHHHDGALSGNLETTHDM